MATPTYKGAGQPAADSGGFLSGFASWFGGSAPVYAGKGQPSSSGSGSGVAYKQAPAKPTASAPAPGVTVIDGEPLSPDSIALVIPRDLVERLVPQKLLEEPQQ
jgi:hypothetical protein